MEKTASKRWRESGSTLSFKEWITRENQKKESVSFVNFDDKTTNSQVQDTLMDSFNSSVNIKTESDKSKIFGLNKTTLILSSIIVVSSLGYFFYQRAKRNK